MLEWEDTNAVLAVNGCARSALASVGDHFETFIKEQVEGGRYASASEVIRDGLRLLEEE